MLIHCVRLNHVVIWGHCYICLISDRINQVLVHGKADFWASILLATPTYLPPQNDPYRFRKNQLALNYSGAMESMPHRIWNKFKAIIPHRSRDIVSPQAVVGDSSDHTNDFEDASAEPSIRAFYADVLSAGHDITTVAFSRDLSQPGIIYHPVFVVRNLDPSTEDENASFRSGFDLNSSGLGYVVGSTCATLSQDLSEPRISTYPTLPHNEQGSEWSTAFGLTNDQDSGLLITVSRPQGVRVPLRFCSDIKA